MAFGSMIGRMIAKHYGPQIDAWMNKYPWFKMTWNVIGVVWGIFFVGFLVIFFSFFI